MAPGNPPKFAAVDAVGETFDVDCCCLDMAAPGSKEAPRTPTEGFDTTGGGCVGCCVGSFGFSMGLVITGVGVGIVGIVGLDRKEFAI